MAFADGHVESLNEDIDALTWSSLRHPQAKCLILAPFAANRPADLIFNGRNAPESFRSVSFCAGRRTGRRRAKRTVPPQQRSQAGLSGGRYEATACVATPEVLTASNAAAKVSQNSSQDAFRCGPGRGRASFPSG